MVHELDLKTAKARCIDLPGTGDYGSATSWALVLAKDERTLWAVSPGYGRVVAIDVATRKATSTFRIEPALVEPRDGDERRALTRRTADRDRRPGDRCGGRARGAEGLQRKTAAHALALGYSPDGATLWKLM